MNSIQNGSILGTAARAALALLALACSKATTQATFADPADAGKALHGLIGSRDQAKLEAIFGAGTSDMFDSGDEVSDQEDRARVKELIDEKVSVEELDADTRILLLGKHDWPFPVPLIKDGARWRFDSAEGRVEIANRLVGRNELLTMNTLSEVVEAQREYAAAGHDGRPPQFAAHFRSSEGKQDGLYWPEVGGAPESPLGDLVAEAAERGYAAKDGEAVPFNGYYFRMLDAQGKSAPGGARSYVDAAGNMTGGFACVAWPAKYGVSGVTTFVVNERGLVFEKDLGKDTDTAAAAIKTYDPDGTWLPAWDPDDASEAATASASEPADKK